MCLSDPGGKSLAHDRVLSTTYIYDNVNNEWRQGVPLPQPIYGHCCTSAQDRIYILGGKTQEKVEVNIAMYLIGRKNIINMYSSV